MVTGHRSRGYETMRAGAFYTGHSIRGSCQYRNCAISFFGVTRVAKIFAHEDRRVSQL